MAIVDAENYAQLLARDLEDMLKLSTTKKLRDRRRLLTLILVGGPVDLARIASIAPRVAALRTVIGEIAEDEIRRTDWYSLFEAEVREDKVSEDGEAWAAATRELFALDEDEHPDRGTLNQRNEAAADELGVVGKSRGQLFQRNYRDQLLLVIARALVAREQAAARTNEDYAPPSEPHDRTAAEVPLGGPSSGEDGARAPAAPAGDGTASSEETASDPGPATEPAQPSLAPADAEPPEEIAIKGRQEFGPRRKESHGSKRTLAAVLAGLAALSAAGAVAVVVTSRGGRHKARPPGAATTKEWAGPLRLWRTASKGGKHRPPPPPPVSPAVRLAPVKWWYGLPSGDPATNTPDCDSPQLKVKPRVLNESHQAVVITATGSGPIYLATPAHGIPTDWSAPATTRPRYRRYGSYLLIPADRPAHTLASPACFATYWNMDRLGPGKSWFSPFGPDRATRDDDLIFRLPRVLNPPLRLAYWRPDRHERPYFSPARWPRDLSDPRSF